MDDRLPALSDRPRDAAGDPVPSDTPSDGKPRWEVTHFCNGIQRSITMTGTLACFDCGEAVDVFDVGDVATGKVAVISDGLRDVES